jgi:glycosyltransferase involved in cell wall biosynthesis
MNPLFSILTVTYNAQATITATLKSVAEQSCRRFEYIIMDGASTDNTVRLAREAAIAEATIYSKPDRGIYDAMNNAIDIARGDYLIFLNAGDAFHSPDVVARLADAITSGDTTPGVVYGQTVLVDADRRYIAPRHLRAPDALTLDDFKHGMMVCHQAFVARRALVPRYDLRWRFSADYEWCIRCLQKSRVNRYVGDEPIIDYLVEGATTRNRWRSLLERLRIMAHYYGTVPTLLRHLLFIRRFLSHRKMLKTSQL